MKFVYRILVFVIILSGGSTAEDPADQTTRTTAASSESKSCDKGKGEENSEKTPQENLTCN